MSDFPAAGSTHTPDNAIEAAARVVHSLTCGECDYHPDQLTQVSAVDREDARRVLAAAAAAIAAHDNAAAAFTAWWPRHAIRHNHQSPVPAREAFDREAFTAGWEAGAVHAAAAERERIRQLAIEHHALTDCYEDDCDVSLPGRPHRAPFADLIGGQL